MNISELKAKAQEIDNNYYHIIAKEEYHEINVKITLKVNMPYQNWLDMHNFYTNANYRANKHDGNIIHAVLEMYTSRLAHFFIETENDYLPAVNDYLTEGEGLQGNPYVEIVAFDIDFQPNFELVSVRINDD